MKTKRKSRTTEPEAPEGSELDLYAFADQRTDTPNERNNEFEDELYQALLAYVEDVTPVPAKFTAALKKILSDGDYRAIIHPPAVARVYRGMAVTEQFLRTALNLSDDDELEPSGDEFAKFTFSSLPAGNMSSWTSNKIVAWKFAEEKMSDQRTYALIMVADTKKNPAAFVSGPWKGLYDLDGLRKYSTEEETFAVDDVHVGRIVWNTESKLLFSYIHNVLA